MAFNSFRLERDVGESQTESTERDSTNLCSSVLCSRDSSNLPSDTATVN